MTREFLPTLKLHDGRRYNLSMDCRERDRLDEELQRATSEWAVLDQKPRPDLTTVASFKEDQALMEKQRAAQYRLDKARNAYHDHCRTHGCLQ